MDLLGGPARHILLYGGSRSGKTFIIVRTIIARALSAAGSRHAILRFRFNHLHASIIADTFPKVMATCWPDIPYNLDRSHWVAEYSNLSQLWFGGLDDKDRAEKILGQEHVSVYLNECSQIQLSSRNYAVTRLAQVVDYELGGYGKGQMRPKMYYDENPPSQAHWSYRMFRQKIDPETKMPLANPNDYACMQINPEDNAANLPPGYIAELDGLPARMRRRFRMGEFGEAAPDALWTEEMIDAHRVVSDDLPDMQRVVIAVDPSGADDEENQGNEEIGIVVAGLGTDQRGYVLEDLSLKAGPRTWGTVAVGAFDRWRADKIVAEINFGGAMVKHVIATAAQGNRPIKRPIPVRVVTASRGKVVRAEPISSLTETGNVRFAGYFHNLEDELVSLTTHGYVGSGSPNRADAFVWAMSELFPGLVQERREPQKKGAVEMPVGAGSWMV